MAKDSIKNLRRRIRSLQAQLAAARHQGQEKKVALLAGALEADEAKLAKLLAQSLKQD